MNWASAIGLEHELQPALAVAVQQASEALGPGPPQLVIAFASAEFGAELDTLPRLLQPWLGDGLLIGCGTAGLIGGGEEAEERSGVALLAGRFDSVNCAAQHLEQATLPPLIASRESWWRLLDLGPQSGASFLLLADPATIDTEACARGIDRAFPGATVVGGLAGGTLQPGDARLFVGRDIHRSGAALLALSGNVIIDPVIAQGCRPIGDPLFVTACEGNLLRALDGRRPAELLAELLERLEPGDRERIGSSLCLGIVLPAPARSPTPGDFLIRNVLGLEPETGSLVVGARLAKNAVVQFHLRDPRSASQELGLRLGAAVKAGASPEAALLFACAGRGSGFFGHTGHDSAALRRLADVPIAGMFCAGEVAPVQGATFVHGYSSVFGLIRRRVGTPAC